MFSRLRTPLYRNTSSTARDHLASERTFLAWMRTGLGFIALGIAIERFSQLDLAALLHQLRDGGGQLQQGANTTDAQSANRLRSQGHARSGSHSQLLVSTLLGTGGGSIAYGTSRYFVNLRLLERGLFQPAYHGPAVLSIAVAGLAGGVYYNSMNNKHEERET